MKLLMTGATGLVGSRISEVLGRETPSIMLPTREDLDVTDRKHVTEWMADKRPDAVIHLASFTDNDAAERERGDRAGACWRVNVEGTKHIVEASRAVGAYVIHLSTGSVFAGDDDHPGPFTETDATSPLDSLSWYGWTKAVAETFIRDGAIIRISHPVKKTGIFASFRSNETEKLDYLHKLVHLFDEKRLFPLFTDQYIPITFIDDIAIAIKALLENRRKGVFHVVSFDMATPYELARRAIANARHVEPALATTTFDAFIKTAPLPLRCSKYHAIDGAWSRKTLRLPPRTWREIVDIVFPPAPKAPDTIT